MNIETLIHFLNESGSDKQKDHNYSVAYEKFLTGRTVNRFLEIGIANHIKGKSSLHAWKNIFSNAHIYGIDNDINKMIFDEKISTFWCDQSSPFDLQRFIIDSGNIKFDVILDDGSHVFKHAINSFKYLINQLSENGIYIIEDVWKINHPYLQNIDQWKNFLNEQNNLQYDIIDCKPDIKEDDSIVIGVWKKI